ncbi:MAG: DUF3592 domain-containing protein [Kofleriaceae bacterium]
MTKALIYALLTVLFGGAAVFAARYMWREIRDHKDWPTVKGTITERGLGDQIATARTPGATYMPRAVYSYEVDGKSYTNDQVWLIRGTGATADAAKKLVDELPNPVDVHYDPENPAQSYLLTNSHAMYYVSLIFGIVLLVVGALQLLIVVTKSNE